MIIEFQTAATVVNQRMSSTRKSLRATTSYDSDVAAVRELRPAAKSSCSVLATSVCRLCGHPLDGKTAAQGSASFRGGRKCDCGCHS